jgi:hypothetical protein
MYHPRGDRWTLSGLFMGYGEKRGHDGNIEKVVILKDVRSDDNGTRVADELWINVHKKTEELSLTPGDRVLFNLMVSRYGRGQFEDGVWKPTQVVLVFSRLTKIRKAESDIRFPSETELDLNERDNGIWFSYLSK